MEQITNFLAETLNIDPKYVSYGLIVISVFAVNYIINAAQDRKLTALGEENARRLGMATKKAEREGLKDEDKPDPPRNFTSEQLKFYDGNMDENTQEPKPVYMAVNGIVFDVSNGRDFYGPGGAYELFAGHECGVALAKFSFDTTYLDDLKGCETLNFGEKEELNGWIDKFTHYRMYPVLGRLVPDDKLPDQNRVLSKEDIAPFNGSSDIPEGYASPPIYVGAGDKVFDMSFGGVLFYGPGCTYNRFAGKDASRALSKMSFDPADTENTDTSDLTEKELKILKDWINTFENRKKYPCVGRIEK